MSKRPFCPASLHWPPAQGLNIDFHLIIDIQSLVAVGEEGFILTARGDCERKTSTFAVKFYFTEEPVYQTLLHRYILLAHFGSFFFTNFYPSKLLMSPYVLRPQAHVQIVSGELKTFLDSKTALKKKANQN